MTTFVNQIILLFFLVASAIADWQYRSRPDLAPPILNITVPANDETSPGYLFIAPFSGYADIDTFHGPRQAAPYIFTDKGDLVWSGFTYFSIWATNFQAGRVNGQDVLFSFEGSHNPRYGHGHGHVTFLDQKYETIKELRAGHHKIMDKHELHIINETTSVFQIYQPKPIDLTPYGGTKEQQWIVDAIFQEVDINTGEVLFEWSSLDHISPKESVLPVYEGQAGSGFNSSDAWDYFHINSVDKNSDGDYLISARDAASIYKIDGNSGEIIWKLGGLSGITSTDFELDSNFTFSFQHHARFLSTSADGKKEVFSFFDNSAHGSENKNGKLVNFNNVSSGKIIEVDTDKWVAKLLFNGVSPDGLLAKSQGSTQVLPNGNVLVNWGSEGSVTEFDKNGVAIFNSYVDSGELGVHAENYRAFKFDWSGFPNEDIAVFSEYTEEGNTIVYVSWNGDTETHKWKFYASDDNKEKVFIGEKRKTGFETSFEFENAHHKTVAVEAYNSKGDLLSTSYTAATEAQVLPFNNKEASLIDNSISEFNFMRQVVNYLQIPIF